ncbi:MAG: RND transporter, partial [Novosphingobium sp.]|nr:RND transporter [Novosphingobium sp.]
MKLRTLLATLPALALTACNLAPKYTRAEAPVPSALPQGPAYAALPAGETSADALGWRDFFTDPRLQSVIAKALADNRDLRV